MTGQRQAHGIGLLFPQSGRAFNVGKEKGDGSSGQSGHALFSIRMAMKDVIVLLIRFLIPIFLPPRHLGLTSTG